MPASNSNSAAADVARVSDEALTDQSKFQLLTITALYVAIKVNERVAISSELFAKMCLGAYTVEEIEDMERTLLSGLSWRCHAPTAHQIGLSILSMILPYVSEIPEETWGFLIGEMKYLTELAVRDYYFSTQRTSTIALAAIFNVISDMRTKEHQGLLGAFLSVIMECFDFDHPKQIFAVRIRLQSLLDKQEPETESVLQEEDVDVVSLDDSLLDETSLDDSDKTFMVSNRSSRFREMKCHLRYERIESDHEEEVALSSPSSSLHDLTSEMQDLQF